MRRIILFSVPNENNLEKLLNLVFPPEFDNKSFAYMPSDGANCPQKYIDPWVERAGGYGYSFEYIDNSVENSTKEAKKLLSCSSLMITGGNTFRLLHNLRKSGLDKSVVEFAQKQNFVLSGFSAGAIVLTPSINICNLPGFDENLDNVTDFSGLNLVDFEVFPHFKSDYQKYLNDYIKSTSSSVKTISDDELIILNKQ